MESASTGSLKEAASPQIRRTAYEVLQHLHRQGLIVYDHASQCFISSLEVLFEQSNYFPERLIISVTTGISQIQPTPQILHPDPRSATVHVRFRMVAILAGKDEVISFRLEANTYERRLTAIHAMLEGVLY